MEADFARARAFLNYNRPAKWGAILSGIATALLYVALLIVLALFADLMVHRGEIPCLNSLPKPQMIRYVDHEMPLPLDAAERATRLKERERQLHRFGVSDPAVLLIAATERKLSERDENLRRSLLWYADLSLSLRDTMGEEEATRLEKDIAGRIATIGIDAAVHQNLSDYGILSLVVRGRPNLQGSLVSWLAYWNPWMWADGNITYLRGLFLAAFALALVRAGLGFLSQMAAARATMEAVTRLRLAVYKHTYRIGALAFRALGSTEAVSASTRHLEVIHSGLFAWLTLSFREPVKFGLLLLFAMLVDFWLALAFLLFAVLVWLVGGQIASFFRRKGRAAEMRAANQLTLIQESLTLIRLVKIYLMEKFNLVRVESQLDRYAQAQLDRYRGEAIYRPVFTLLGLLAALTLLLAAGHVLLAGYLGVTSVMVMVTALVSLYWPMTAWLNNRRLIRRSRQSARALFEFLDRTGSVAQVVEADFIPALSHKLEFDKVTLHEPGTGRRFLEEISLSIVAGQRVAFVGPQEREKHALVYLLPRFLDPQGGEIRFDKKNIRWVTLDSLRTQTAMVLQHNLVFNDTVASNIGCGDPSYSLAKVIEAAKIAHAHQFVQNLPKGYETVIGDLGHPLKAGEMFRIALARAILRDPAILVIEEPLTPLDDDTKGLIDDTYARVLPGRTVIFLPHRLSTIRSCDQVFLIHDGKLEAAGDHRQLLATSDLYRHLQYLEFNEFAGLATAPVATPVLGAQVAAALSIGPTSVGAG